MVVFIFIYIIMIGTVNGVNLTDGLDGLASSVTLLIVVFFSIAALKSGSSLVLSMAVVLRGLRDFLAVQCLSGTRFYGRYRFAGTWRFCCRYGCGVENAFIYSNSRDNLSGRGFVSNIAGCLF